MGLVVEQRTRIAIADDLTMFRVGLGRLVKRLPNLELVGEAATGRDTLALVEHLDPDVLLLDLYMPQTNPKGLIACLHERRPKLRILVMTGHAEPAVVRSVLAVGASGVVLKVSGFDVLREGIQRVIEGRMFVDPELHLETRATTDDGAGDPLTEREREVMALLARGASYRKIGEQLHIGERTVETHRRRIADKLGVSTRAELVTCAMRMGMLVDG